MKDIVREILKIEDDLTHKTFVDTTTVHPDTTKEVAQWLSQRGILFVAAPVFGPPPSAEKGQLMMALAGPKREFLEMLSHALKGVLAQDILIVSDVPEKAVLMKTLG